jgi:hypothetical protein
MKFREKENAIAFWEKFIDVSPEDSQIETIKEAVEILSNPSFVLPPFGSAVTIEQALRIGGYTPIEETDSKTLYRSDEPVRTYYDKMEDRAIKMEAKTGEPVNDQAEKNEIRAKNLSQKSDETANDSSTKNENKADKLFQKSDEMVTDSSKKNEGKADKLFQKSDETVNDSSKKNEGKADKLLQKADETINEHSKKNDGKVAQEVPKKLLKNDKETKTEPTEQVFESQYRNKINDVNDETHLEQSFEIAPKKRK